MPELEFGYSRQIKLDWAVAVGSDKRDRLTGYVLDEGGGYRVPAVVDGVVYSPRFHSCGTVECLAVGANVDFSDVDTLRWVKAADAKSLNDISRVLAGGAAVASGGAAPVLAGSSVVTGLVSGYLKEDFAGAVTSVGVSMGFESYAASRGVPVEAAGKLANALASMGVWDSIADNAKRIFSSDE